MIKNKKAQNDVSIVFALVLFMFLGTIFIYYITIEFSENSATNPDIDTDIGYLNTLTLIGQLLFWRYPLLPFWADAIWKVLEFTIIFLIYRAFRSGSG